MVRRDAQTGPQGRGPQRIRHGELGEQQADFIHK